jgi:hypothetical protein
MDVAHDPSRRTLLAAVAAALAAPTSAKGKRGRKAKPPLVSAVARVTDLIVTDSPTGPTSLVTLEMWRINVTNGGVGTAEFGASVDAGPADAVRASIVRAVQEFVAAEVAVEPERVSVLLI